MAFIPGLIFMPPLAEPLNSLTRSSLPTEQHCHFLQVEGQARQYRGFGHSCECKTLKSEKAALTKLGKVMLDNAILKGIVTKMVPPVARREAVVHLH